MPPTKTAERKKMKPIVAWAGFSDGKMSILPETYTMEMAYNVYLTRASAKKCYEDVRKVIITEA
jgi:hypothetical protein